VTESNTPVLLVGSINGASARDVMTTCGETLGSLLRSLPDGELGKRHSWISFVAEGRYEGHPDLELIFKPPPVDSAREDEHREVGDEYIPATYGGHMKFSVREGVSEIFIEDLGYAQEAEPSYRIFCELREAGTISKDVRFQVGLPSTASCVLPFVTNYKDFVILAAAYEDALIREVQALTRFIPPNDLAIQFDSSREILALELGEGEEAFYGWKFPEDISDYYQQSLRRVCATIPAETTVGIHLCYGDLGHRHMVEPKDLSVVVNLANAASRTAGRPINWVHMPVPQERDDDAYFEPLLKLDLHEAATVFVGLVHHTDGVKGSLARLKRCKKYLPAFGISTECGMGRRPLETIASLLEIHRDVASDSSAQAAAG